MENNSQKTIKQESTIKKPWVISLIYFIVIFGALLAFLFWQSEKNTILIENSELNAPIINLTPSSPGILNALYVKEGQTIKTNTQVALIGSQIISSKDGGIVVSAAPLLGAYFMPGQTVVSIVNNREMKVIGQIDETKGLRSIKEGQRATFSVDAYPGKNYEGIVNQISPTSNENSVVFSISDKRPVKKFDVNVVFNADDYPELKSGMSAKITVYTK
ncbi:MAG: efflux RND transporter periplasmic adaptor subunit [bacterium]